MPKSQPLDQQLQQHQLAAYGGIEAGTSQCQISFDKPQPLHRAC